MSKKSILIVGGNSPMIRKFITYHSKSLNLFLVIRNLEKFNKSYDEEVLKNVNIIQSDLKEAQFIEKLKDIPELDGFVYLAGVTNIALIKHLNKTNLKSVFELNYFIPYEIASHLIKSKKLNRQGNMIFISSLSATYNTAVGISQYSNSKAALSNLVQNLAIELKSKKIKVNAICPGLIKTDFIEDINNSTSEDFLGKPESISDFIEFLLLKNDWINGQNIIIDGGQSIIS